MHTLFVTLLALYVILNVFDYISTGLLLKKTRVSVDPVMLAARSHVGGAWWVIGLLFIPIVYVLLIIPNERLATGLTALLVVAYGYVVYRNYRNLWVK